MFVDLYNRFIWIDPADSYDISLLSAVSILSGIPLVIRLFITYDDNLCELDLYCTVDNQKISFDILQGCFHNDFSSRFQYPRTLRNLRILNDESCNFLYFIHVARLLIYDNPRNSLYYVNF